MNFETIFIYKYFNIIILFKYLFNFYVTAPPINEKKKKFFFFFKLYKSYLQTQNPSQIKQNKTSKIKT
jgi:hypothetical protein